LLVFNVRGLLSKLAGRGLKVELDPVYTCIFESSGILDPCLAIHGVQTADHGNLYALLGFFDPHEMLGRTAMLQLREEREHLRVVALILAQILLELETFQLYLFLEE